MFLTILLVEDDAVQALARKAVLASTGHNVFIAKGAREALDLLNDPEFSNKLGLMITDHLMPQMNGAQLVSELRPKFPSLPVLVLSGLPGAEAEYENLNVHYQLKPIAPAELIAIVYSIGTTVLGRTA